MNEPGRRFSGGCLCGALRYEAEGAPNYMGHCYCEDCRKASGSGFIPFIGFPASTVRVSGDSLKFRSKAANGNIAVRNSCPVCGSLVFGGDVGKDTSLHIYAGTLDDASLFHPTIAIFTRGRPDWAVIPSGLKIFERSPQG
jgi:hypothetical protein